MKIRKRLLLASLMTLLIVLPDVPAAANLEVQSALTPMETLGKMIFFDTDLSANSMMSCATCHAPEVGYTGPDAIVNDTTVVYPGAISTRFGNRKPPTAAYGGESPVLYFDETEELWIGGMFWDGRATGWTLGDPLAEQAQGPFLNPLEQAMPNARTVCVKVALSDYAGLFEEVWGSGSLDYKKDVTGTYERIARSISAYEKSDEVNPFSSKYDFYLKGEAELSELELEGLNLFNGKAMCSACHISEGEQPLFTDFTYDNLGIPRNEDNPFYDMPKKWNPDGEEWTDVGLGGFLMAAGYPEEVYEPELGKFKVPTLRNVDLRPYEGFVKAFGHNGYFKSLEDIVEFYNSRDEGDWPEPEYAATMNSDELGSLGLTPHEVDAIVEFLKALSDGYEPLD
ncbi:cytochrome-c peroxidase [Youngiibacter fragilis]|uniref:Methylamine utilization protein n=1 Tax=Youngiibacter fragilis 232.1 TaxID=994573 RepID=V7I8U9_9CLOT|nr:cytochrome c peroxidase [Youngiibacter fragilis]ETA82615.1 methylamine utilization protein [Youngiibacter fragilis 232.1]